MARIAVVGHTNLETAVHEDNLRDTVADAFHDHALSTTVSGVGVNVALALQGLGNDVRFASVVGSDVLGAACIGELEAHGLDASYVVRAVPATAQSLSRYDAAGRRRNLVDLKDVQQAIYPADRVGPLFEGVDLAVLCNIGYARPLLDVVRVLDVPIATDVHALARIDDSYNKDWIDVAHVLFASHERIVAEPRDFVRSLVTASPNRSVAALGMGADGSMLAMPGREAVHVPSVRTRPVVSTLGAGDALFSAFVDAWLRGLDPVVALRRATVFASWKVGASGGAAGLLDRAALDELVATSR